MKKRIIAAAFCICLLFAATVAKAQFGLGITVYDPSVYLEAVTEVEKLVQQYNQLVETYEMITSQYNQMLWMAKEVPGDLSRFRAVPTPWFLSSATNTYGTTGGWISAINTGANVPEGYQSAIDPLQVYGAALSNVPADQVGPLEKHYATVELADGANEDGIETIGTLRSNAPQVENAIQNLEDASLDSDPNYNTEIAVLNKSTPPRSSACVTARTRTSCSPHLPNSSSLTRNDAAIPRPRPSTITLLSWRTSKVTCPARRATPAPP